LITKIQRQPPPSASSPPIGRPNAAATEPTAPQPAIAAAQRCGGNAASSSPSAAGIAEAFERAQRAIEGRLHALAA
jgi:hypothetical protein